MKEVIDASYFVTDTYRRVTSKEEIDGYEAPAPTATPDPEVEACFTSECLEAFNKYPRKIKGESFVL